MTLVLNPVNADDAPSLMYPVKVVETSDPWYFMMLLLKVIVPVRLSVEYFTPAAVDSRAIYNTRLFRVNRVVENEVVWPVPRFLNWIVHLFNVGFHWRVPVTESPGETLMGVEWRLSLFGFVVD